MNRSKRNINFDVLRCLAMLLVVGWHCIRRMGLSNAPEAGGIGMVNFLVFQFSIIICSACVNLFVLISGYFLASKPFNWKRVILLWLEVFFYGITIGLLFYFLHPGSMTTRELLSLLCPVTGDNYWFFQKYFGLVCLAPFLSAAVNNLNRAQYNRLLLVTVIIGCTLTWKIPFGEIMVTSKGFSLLWFVVLFFWGGYFRRFPMKMSSRQALWAWLSVSALGFLFIVGKSLLRHSMVFETPAYNSWGFFIAIFLFIWMKEKPEMDSAWARTASSFVPYLFGVYLISEHPAIRKWFWRELLDWPSLINQVWFFPVMLFTVVAIFLLCILIDYGRSWLFKVVGLERLAGWLGGKGALLVNRICGDSSTPSSDHVD